LAWSGRLLDLLYRVLLKYIKIHKEKCLKTETYQFCTFGLCTKERENKLKDINNKNLYINEGKNKYKERKRRRNGRNEQGHGKAMLHRWE
jgi:hypothetical protein